jgi:hypothetical protein
VHEEHHIEPSSRGLLDRARRAFGTRMSDLSSRARSIASACKTRDRKQAAVREIWNEAKGEGEQGRASKRWQKGREKRGKEMEEAWSAERQRLEEQCDSLLRKLQVLEF